MIRIILAGSLLLGSIYAAHAYNFGRLGVTFGKLGASGKAGVAGPPPVGCSGAIDLSNGCVQPMLR